MPQQTELLDITQAAAFLRVSEASLRRWTNAGLLACYRIGGRRERRFRRADLVALLESHPRVAPVARKSVLKVSGNAPHLCALYTSDRARTRQAASFLAGGLDAGAVCFLGATASVQKRVQRSLKQQRRSVQRDIERGRLVLLELADDVALQIYVWRTQLEAAVRSGAHTLRVVGDVSGAGFSRHVTLDEVLDFESEYDRLVMRRFPVASLCLYDARLLSGVETARVVAAHAGVLSRATSDVVS